MKQNKQTSQKAAPKFEINQKKEQHYQNQLLASLLESEVNYSKQVTESYDQIDLVMSEYLASMVTIPIEDLIKNILCLSCISGRICFSVLEVFMKSLGINSLQSKILIELFKLPFFAFDRKVCNASTEQNKYKDSFDAYTNLNVRLIIMNELHVFCKQIIIQEIDSFNSNKHLPISGITQINLVLFFLIFSSNLVKGNEATLEGSNNIHPSLQDKSQSLATLRVKSDLLFQLFDSESHGYIESWDHRYLKILRLHIFHCLFYSILSTYWKSGIFNLP